MVEQIAQGSPSDLQCAHGEPCRKADVSRCLTIEGKKQPFYITAKEPRRRIGCASDVTANETWEQSALTVFCGQSTHNSPNHVAGNLFGPCREVYVSSREFSQLRSQPHHGRGHAGGIGQPRDFRQIDTGAVRIAFARAGIGMTINSVAQGFFTDAIADLSHNEGFESAAVDLGEFRHRRDAAPVQLEDDASIRNERKSCQDALAPRRPNVSAALTIFVFRHTFRHGR